MQASLSHAPLLRLTAEQRRQPFMHLQHAGGRRQGNYYSPRWIMKVKNIEGPEACIKQVGEILGQKHLKDQKKEVTQMISDIRARMRRMEDGDISISPYDTAWVALVKKIDGSYGPQFPSSISWIIQNQLSDGSWGDEAFFVIHDRMINTLACVITLTSWNIHEDTRDKGLSYIRENFWRLEENELDDEMLAGFEITFPQLLEMATDLGLDVPCDEPVLQAIFAKRDLKLARFPMDLLHDAPTTLLYSIEGMKGLDWKRLLKLQCPDGSIMSSPAPTAYALMQTGDKKCLEFLDGITKTFSGGVPYYYPVDLFERMWLVDRLMRLGISRYFPSEIEECLEFVYRYWREDGLPATSENPLSDSDCTAMGFRLLRLHGYDVSPRVFRHYEKDGEFCCFPGQANQSVTAVYSLYRGSQVAFPGEEELRRAEIYSHEFLRERHASHELKDKWLIPKDLPGEVGYALDFPWKASLPRIETRMYLEQYGGVSDVWIGKVLYRMALINNELLLQTAKSDFSDFQRLCQIEWNGLKKWCNRKNLQIYGVSPKRALQAYFLAAANIFEPDRATERLGWARTSVLAEAVSSHFRHSTSADQTRKRFIDKLTGENCDKIEREANDPTESNLLNALDEHIGLLAFDDASCHNLCEIWKQWLVTWTSEDCEGNAALLFVHTVEICSGRNRSLTDKGLDVIQFSQLEELTSSICRKICAQDGNNMEDSNNQVDDLEMKELTRCVLHGDSVVSEVTRKTFLHVVKTFYYVARVSPETVEKHISKVMFEDII